MLKEVHKEFKTQGKLINREMILLPLDQKISANDFTLYPSFLERIKPCDLRHAVASL